METITRKEAFILKWRPHAHSIAYAYAARLQKAWHLLDDMLSEADLRLVQAANKFLGDDSQQERYVQNYVSQATLSGCAEVIRQSRTISTPRDNESWPNPSVSLIEGVDFSVRHVDSIKSEKSRTGYPLFRVHTLEDCIDLNTLHRADESLFSQASRKRVVNWREFFDDDEAEILEQFIATYRGSRQVPGPTAEERTIRRQLSRKVRQILERYARQCHLPYQTTSDACTTTCERRTTKPE
jgi:hypothetical protein